MATNQAGWWFDGELWGRRFQLYIAYGWWSSGATAPQNLFEVVMLRTNKFPEVFDVHGNLVRMVAVAPGEVTCLRCGETSGGERFGAARGGREKTTMVATVSYLHPDEYRIEQ